MPLRALVSTGWFAVAVAGIAAAADPATLAGSGAPGMAPCAGCHGAAGEGQSGFPRLAGMNAAYLARQLEDFAAGRRENAVMAPIAQALAPADRQALAQHYARLPLPAAPATAGDNPLGARLAQQGVWSKGVPACEQCHGPGGRGVGAAFPMLAGQSAAYIGAQLRAFRSGQRSNDPQQLMRAPASKLTEEEIDALAQWFSNQPARPPGGAP